MTYTCYQIMDIIALPQCLWIPQLRYHFFSLTTFLRLDCLSSALLCSPQNEDSSFHFDGSGYSVVEKTLRVTVTQIIMLFSTFSPNGLLLYLASNGTVSIYSQIAMKVFMFNDRFISIYKYIHMYDILFPHFK